ncbi:MULTISPECIES: hypothetical protein [Tatumella]|uniref:Dirigent protein n=1 Tax=Tatumella terrea TaxID=419007 RepID=A0ABW1VTI1_9GAMM|nr:hypothetical protein [Tatumella sp. JGM118]MBS0909548.1 hypothetical protein [Tatumella sp. JGM118]
MFIHKLSVVLAEQKLTVLRSPVGAGDGAWPVGGGTPILAIFVSLREENRASGVIGNRAVAGDRERFFAGPGTGKFVMSFASDWQDPSSVRDGADGISVMIF